MIRFQDDYDEDDSSEDVYNGEPPNKINDLKGYPQIKRRKNAKKKIPDSSEEEDDDDGGGIFGRFAMPNVGKYFQNTFDSIGDVMPNMPLFGDDDSGEEDSEYDIDEEAMERVPKNKESLSNYFKMRERIKNTIQEKSKEKSKRWYDKFFFGSNEEVITAPAPVVTTTTESNFFNWFGNKEETTEAAPVQTTAQTQSKFRWCNIQIIFGIFDLF